MVKLVLRRDWIYIRDTFKYYSTPGPTPFNVGWNAFTQFAHDCEVRSVRNPTACYGHAMSDMGTVQCHEFGL